MSTEPTAHYRWSLEDGVAVVEVLTRELNEPRLAAEFEAQLRGLLTPRAADRILIDFRNTKFMTSTSFGALVRFVKAALEAGVRVAVCGMEPAVRMGADVLCLDQYIPVVDDERAGLAALAAGGPNA
jgi:anti-anti-sigma factor